MTTPRFFLCALLIAAPTASIFAEPDKLLEPSPVFSAKQVQGIETIVHQYLVQNPGVLLEASNALRAKMEQEQQGKAMAAIKAEKMDLFNDNNIPFIGNPKASEIIVEFMDYQCGHCKEMHEAIKNLAQKNPNLKIILRDWPIFEGASLTAAKVAIAAFKQGKYFEIHNALLAAPNPLTDEKIFSIAKQVGLNVDQLKKDMDSAAVTDQIKATYDLAGKIGLAGTPAFIVANPTTDEMTFISGATTEEKLQAVLVQFRAPSHAATAAK